MPFPCTSTTRLHMFPMNNKVAPNRNAKVPSIFSLSHQTSLRCPFIYSPKTITSSSCSTMANFLATTSPINPSLPLLVFLVACTYMINPAQGQAMGLCVINCGQQAITCSIRCGPPASPQAVTCFQGCATTGIGCLTACLTPATPPPPPTQMPAPPPPMILDMVL